MQQGGGEAGKGGGDCGAACGTASFLEISPAYVCTEPWTHVPEEREYASVEEDNYRNTVLTSSEGTNNTLSEANHKTQKVNSDFERSKYAM